jgi:hypothetical protein
MCESHCPRHLDHPIGPLREAYAIIRQLLDTGTISRFDGAFYNIRNMFLTACRYKITFMQHSRALAPRRILILSSVSIWYE